jgi:hypothetical protein
MRVSSRTERSVERNHYTWSTRPRRLADKRAIHANRARLRQWSRRLIREAA